MAGAVDWGDGDYARTAQTLTPAAEVVLDAVGVAPGERLLDVACGTGNAAHAAAARGARVVGVDASAALVEAARARGAGPEFVVGDVLALPVPDASFDVLVSVFGVIFAPDAERAAAELLRVLRPGGRLAVSSWVPTGPIAAAGRLLFAALPASPSDPPRWDDPDWVRELLGREVEVAEHQLAFTAASPAAWFAEQEQRHPVWRWARRQLDGARWERVRDESVALLADANEDPAAFRTTSRYLVSVASR